MSDYALTKHALPVALLLSGLAHLLMFYWSSDDASDVGQSLRESVRVQVELVKQEQQQAMQQRAEAATIETVDDIVAVDNGPVVRKNIPDTRQPIKTQAVVEHKLVKEEVAEQVPAIKQESLPLTAGKDSNHLLKLIYLEINKHKHYPYIAKRQGREGLVKLNFVMHPDGKVTDVAVVETSHYAVLDNAARRAVEAISPFHLATEYLDSYHSYNVSIDFRLN